MMNLLLFVEVDQLWEMHEICIPISELSVRREKVIVGALKGP